MNWLTKLERKYGRICIPNLISILVGAQVLVYAVELFVNQYVSLYLSLSRTALLMGQVWRVITFVFVPFSGAGRSASSWASTSPGSSGAHWKKSGATSASICISCWAWWAQWRPAC